MKYLAFFGAHVAAVGAWMAEAFAAMLALEGLLPWVNPFVLLQESRRFYHKGHTNL